MVGLPAGAPLHARPRPCLREATAAGLTGDGPGKPHLADSLGAAVLSRFLDKGWIRRQAGSRALLFSSEGLRRFEDLARP
ncbi:hypothetical protein [Oricola indica]|uniref:hypothetical protein n=1 Tax=Oricola indica TaxID=2872591 RepID=UPI003CCBB82B